MIENKEKADLRSITLAVENSFGGGGKLLGKEIDGRNWAPGGGKEGGMNKLSRDI